MHDKITCFKKWVSMAEIAWWVLAVPAWWPETRSTELLQSLIQWLLPVIPVLLKGRWETEAGEFPEASLAYTTSDNDRLWLRERGKYGPTQHQRLYTHTRSHIHTHTHTQSTHKHQMNAHNAWNEWGKIVGEKKIIIPTHKWEKPLAPRLWPWQDSNQGRFGRW